MKQHADHLAAFNAQARKLGGKEQTQPNAKYAKIVEAAKPTLKAPGDVVMLATALETVATQTYAKNASLLEDSPTKELMASVTGVEAQHRHVARCRGAAGSGSAGAHRHPDDVGGPPGGGRRGGFPRPFEGTDMASPPEEGAVK